jgi:hypothetical protein
MQDREFDKRCRDRRNFMPENLEPKVEPGTAVRNKNARRSIEIMTLPWPG